MLSAVGYRLLYAFIASDEDPIWQRDEVATTQGVLDVFLRHHKRGHEGLEELWDVVDNLRRLICNVDIRPSADEATAGLGPGLGDLEPL
eukprot:scaffold197801_cov41-Prasinocladus_malaysianus.AAC.1